MSRGAIHPKLLAFPLRRSTGSLLLGSYSIRSASASALSASSPPTTHRQFKIHHQHRLCSDRSVHAITTLARPLADDRRARLQPYLDARETILRNWKPEHDANHLIQALDAAKETHGLDAELREECSSFLGKGTYDPLKGIDEGLRDPPGLLKPDAPWGLVVYRTSYRDGDDALWQRILDEILWSFIDLLEVCDRLDLLPRHRLVVMDDEAQFDGATPDTVREHFRQWALDELRWNWRVPPMPEDEIAKVEAGWRGVDRWHGARYNFCILVDDLCLESVYKMYGPVIKVVNKHWFPYGPDELEELKGEEEEEGENRGWEGGVTNNEFEDVGWIYKEPYQYVDIQNDLQQPEDWVDHYVRPPLTWPLMDLEDIPGSAPGFWRRNGKSS